MYSESGAYTLSRDAVEGGDLQVLAGLLHFYIIRIKLYSPQRANTLQLLLPQSYPISVNVISVHLQT